MSAALANALSTLLDDSITVLDSRPLGGGCISEVLKVTVAEPSRVDRPRHLVVKRNDATMAENFRCESEGLRAIAESNTIRVPKPLANGIVDHHAYLAMEFIESEPRNARKQLFETFGCRLATFHRDTQGQTLGWQCDNFLGAAPQPNQACSSWVEFFATQRLEFQLRWAIEQHHADPTLRRDVQTIIDSLADLLDGREDATSLLHGDLWSGNYLFDSNGQPVLIDPAVYHGCREAEWGMIHLFGGCPPEFTDAYESEWAMPYGWERRAKIYLLYHELNHLNLFGASYLSGCKSTARQVLSMR
ncbi:MAG: fructosamine kinase family protein [Planctomycetota bacterium]